MPAVTAVRIGVLSAVLLAAVGCRGSAPPAASQQTPPAQATPSASPSPSAPQPPAGSARPAARPRTATPVDFELLVALVPDFPDWTRTTPHGIQASAGIALSAATAEYTKGDSTIKLEIMDSAFNDLILAPLSMMLVPAYAERTPEGYKRFAAVNGSPGFESWRNDVNEGDVTVVVADRFVITARGLNVASIDVVRSLVKAIDVGALATIR